MLFGIYSYEYHNVYSPLYLLAAEYLAWQDCHLRAKKNNIKFYHAQNVMMRYVLNRETKKKDKKNMKNEKIASYSSVASTSAAFNLAYGLHFLMTFLFVCTVVNVRYYKYNMMNLVGMMLLQPTVEQKHSLCSIHIKMPTVV